MYLNLAVVLVNHPLWASQPTTAFICLPHRLYWVEMILSSFLDESRVASECMILFQTSKDTMDIHQQRFVSFSMYQKQFRQTVSRI